jgi:hypothetical protein
MDDPPRAFGFGRSQAAPRSALARRHFLAVLAGAAAYAALQPSAGWTKRLARPLPPLQPWALPPNPPADPLDLGRALAGAAILAPSQWNTQPWRLEVSGTTLRILADGSRAMPINDPDRCGMMLSLGAALENVLVALRAYGFRPAVTYFPQGEKAAVVASVSWSKSEGRRDRDLFAAIPERRTNRRSYDGRGLFMQSRAALSAVVPNELRLYWVDDKESIRRVADLAFEATRARVLDRRAEAECYAWTRFGDDEARERGDGVTIDDLEINGPARWLAGRSLHPGSHFIGFGAGSAAKQAREQVRSVAALALLTTPSDGEAARLAGGQAYERFALRATHLGIAHHPISAPIERAPYRAELMRPFGAIDERPLMLLRVGHAHRPRSSMRRGVALVASFRAS